jgi:hypothetical protein
MTSKTAPITQSTAAAATSFQPSTTGRFVRE